MAVRTFTAVIHKEDGLYVADCPEVGTVSQGCSVEEALANLREATELYLEEVPLPVVSSLPISFKDVYLPVERSENRRP